MNEYLNCAMFLLAAAVIRTFRVCFPQVVPVGSCCLSIYSLQQTFWIFSISISALKETSGHGRPRHSRGYRTVTNGFTGIKIRRWSLIFFQLEQTWGQANLGAVPSHVDVKVFLCFGVGTNSLSFTSISDTSCIQATVVVIGLLSRDNRVLQICPDDGGSFFRLKHCPLSAFHSTALKPRHASPPHDVPSYSTE
jgi:hypothetical protein